MAQECRFNERLCGRTKDDREEAVENECRAEQLDSALAMRPWPSAKEPHDTHDRERQHHEGESIEQVIAPVCAPDQRLACAGVELPHVVDERLKALAQDRCDRNNCDDEHHEHTK